MGLPCPGPSHAPAQIPTVAPVSSEPGSLHSSQDSEWSALSPASCVQLQLLGQKSLTLSRGDKESTRDYRIEGVPLMVLFMLFFLPGHRTFEANCQASLKTSAICPQDVLVNINFLASAL